ncbi:hypothetical protein [Amycolatopsis albispora]|uniref:Uncharacterized protein n=1 Tax=Amycolatopsis albispora TaxID=1804986 RepID=A0A344LD11_9PSEU|nr:hypothetical protein [Amycolatopsis albispora]AXB45935.1 hypothetical protein A4R43_28495 [Amycolatopsis albispora]
MTDNREYWLPITRKHSPVRAIASRRRRRATDQVLVAELHDGRWASTNIQLGSTTQVTALTLGMALNRQVKRLYEVDTSPQTLVFTSLFETETEGKVLEGDIVVTWRISDPVAAVTTPKFDHLGDIRSAAEDLLRAIALNADVESVSDLSNKADQALAPMKRLPNGVISWGDAATQFRLTGMGTLHRHSVESIRRARIVDREQRELDRERINFYSDVIKSGRISLLALMLSNEKEQVQKVLDYIQLHEIPLGSSVLDGQDPVRHAIGQIMSTADDFELQQMRSSLLRTWQSQHQDDALGILRDALGSGTYDKHQSQQ